MSDYAQPEFYRFNEDSLKLVKFVSEHIKVAESILDLGAGSGIIGIELANKLRPAHLTLLELQDDFLPYLKANIHSQMSPGISCTIEHTSFGNWIPDKKYDLIVANPPYFLPGHGQKSSDSRKQLARTFDRDGWEVLITLTRKCLADNGRAFFVLRHDEKLLQILRHFHFKETIVENIVILEFTATEYKVK